MRIRKPFQFLSPCGCLMLVVLAGCSALKPLVGVYPLIPIPTNFAVCGISFGSTTDESEICLSVPSSAYTRDSETSAFAKLLTKYGWRPCADMDNDCWSDIPTDTAILGAYRFGWGTNSPILLIGLGTLPTQAASPPSTIDESTYLEVKHCGTITTTNNTAHISNTGCQVLLP